MGQLRNTPMYEAHGHTMTADQSIDHAIARARMIKDNYQREMIVAKLFSSRAVLHEAMVELKHNIIEGHRPGGM